MKIIFTPIQDLNDERELFIKTKNVEITEGSDTYEVLNELFDLMIQKYQELLEY